MGAEKPNKAGAEEEGRQVGLLPRPERPAGVLHQALMRHTHYVIQLYTFIKENIKKTNYVQA